MAGHQLLDRFAGPAVTMTVYGSEPDPALVDRLESQRIAVDWQALPAPDSESFVVVRQSDQFAGTVRLDVLQEFLSGSGVARRTRPVPSPDEDVQLLLSSLTNTVLPSLGRGSLLATAHEFEDRAYRIGRGTLRVSFQSLSTFRAQVDRYRTLADDTELDIHIYGRDDADPPAIPGVTVHTISDDEFARLWLLAFDGNGNADDKCALVAEETDPGQYRGFWTYDSPAVDEILASVAAPL
jgi:hypothetical protein